MRDIDHMVFQQHQKIMQCSSINKSKRQLTSKVLTRFEFSASDSATLCNLVKENVVLQIWLWLLIYFQFWGKKYFFKTTICRKPKTSPTLVELDRSWTAINSQNEIDKVVKCLHGNIVSEQTTQILFTLTPRSIPLVKI